MFVGVAKRARQEELQARRLKHKSTNLSAQVSDLCPTRASWAVQMHMALQRLKVDVAVAAKRV